MNVLYCGTAAAEAWPALFCECEPCAKARELGGKNIRTRAAYMLGDRVRIDFGPDSLLHSHNYGLKYELLEHLLISHHHEDHWLPEDIGNRHPGMSHVPAANTLNIYGTQLVHNRLVEAVGSDLDKLKVKSHVVEPWIPIDLGQGMTATPVVAQHDSGALCFNYLIDDNGRLALFANDTGWYDEPTWEFLTNKPISLLSLDCTYGYEDNQGYHMGAPVVVRAKQEFIKRGALASDAQVIATHFSHNGRWLHHELEEFFAPHGIAVAWDGLRLEF